MVHRPVVVAGEDIEALRQRESLGRPARLLLGQPVHRPGWTVGFKPMRPLDDGPGNNRNSAPIPPAVGPAGAVSYAAAARQSESKRVASVAGAKRTWILVKCRTKLAATPVQKLEIDVHPGILGRLVAEVDVGRVARKPGRPDADDAGVARGQRPRRADGRDTRERGKRGGDAASAL